MSGFFAHVIVKKEKPRDYTFLWLKHDLNESHMLFCHRCQNPLIRYQGNVAMMSPGTPEDTPMDFPFELACKNCPQVYLIQGIV